MAMIPIRPAGGRFGGFARKPESVRAAGVSLKRHGDAV